MIYPNPKHKAIRLSPYERSKLKRDLYYGRAQKKCETCGDPVPWSINGKWDQFKCAHLSHIKSRGSGGDDSKENCKIECWNCHGRFHGPNWSLGKGGRIELKKDRIDGYVVVYDR